jgi:KDO2-lipid IV(A) lauroyltransferase
MVDTRATPVGSEDEDEDDANVEPSFPCLLPAGLRSDWPAPRRAVLGTRGGCLAWIEYGAARLVLTVLSALPHWLRIPIVGAVARASKAIDRRRSQAARVFIRQALGSTMSDREVEARVLQAWRHLFKVTLDTETLHRRVPLDRIRSHCEIEICPDARRILDSGIGSILATAHVGDWETGSAVMPWIGFDPFYVVSKPPKNRPLSVHAQRLRERHGVRLLPRRGAMKDAPAVVRGGGMLGLILDQRARKRPILVPFFGRQARCDRSAAVLLKRLRAPVVFGACYLTPSPSRWRISIPAVLWPENLEGRSVEEITRLVNQGLEKLILAAPEQYFWLHDRYRDA